MDKNQSHNKFIEQALLNAQKAYKQDEVPIGAIIVKDNKIIGTGYNQSICNNDPTAHAEIMAIRNAAEHLKNYRLTGCTLYCTLEPCMMCAGSIVHARIDTLVYAAPDPKTGVITSKANLLESNFLNHKVKVIPGILAQESANLLQSFFKDKRINRNKKQEIISVNRY